MYKAGNLQRRFLVPLGMLVLALLVAACGNGSPQPVTYTASGTIKDDAGEPIAGVTLQFSGITDTVTTDGEGKWSSPKLTGKVTVTAVHSDYTFEPSIRSVSEDTIGVDFTGTKTPDTEPGPGDPDPDDPDPDDPTPGDPEPGDAIQVFTLEDLQNMRNNPSAHYILMNDIDASETGGWNEGEGFKPIGYRETPGGRVDNNPFTGTFDGGGHIIEGLYISRVGQSETGLFGRVDGGTIRNVGLVDVDVNHRNAGDVGALVGAMYGGTIENSYSTGSVTKTGTIGVHVGGLVGFNSTGTITDSYSSAKVTSDWRQVGGLVGTNQAGLIERSYSTGEVKGDDGVGGLVGVNLVSGARAGIIKDSYSVGPATGREFVGGLVGDNRSGEIYTSYSAGAVSGSRWTGGLVGYGNQNPVIEDSYWDKETSRRSGSWKSDNNYGLTTSEMKSGAPFSAAWKPSVWRFPAGEYPQLVDNPREEDL